LDPSQNKAFVDDYIDMPYDLSKVLFIANSNDLGPLSLPLLNRMEIINFDGYTRDEKLVIAKRFLVPKQMKEKGFEANEFNVTDDAIGKIIDDYTQEMGVRSIDKAIAKLARKAALQMAVGEAAKVEVTVDNLEEFLGSDTIEHPKIADDDEIGHTNGMAWTAVGGDLLAVEASINPNENQGTQVTATGHLGIDMTESSKKAVTAVKNFLARHPELKDKIKHPLENADIHIDAPTVIPKDGPSAGITMVTSLLSCIFDVAVRRTVSMTGEITTREKVLAIGGLDRKILAAIGAGVTDILVPVANHKSKEEVKAKLPPEDQSRVRFHEVASIEDLVSLKDQFGNSIVFALPILPVQEQTSAEDNVAQFPLSAPVQTPVREYNHG
jgi:ATP-dependent Lon protease